MLPSSHFSHDGEDSGLVQIILQRLHGSSEFALGNAAILKSLLVQYLPVIMTLSKLTEMKIPLLQNCVGQPSGL